MFGWLQPSLLPPSAFLGAESLQEQIQSGILFLKSCCKLFSSVTHFFSCEAGDEVIADYVYIDFFLFSLALFDLGCREVMTGCAWPLLQGTRSCDATILNHPSIKKFLESPSRSSSPAHQGSDAPSANHSESDSLSQHNDFFLDKDSGSLDADERLANSLDQRQSRSAGRVK